MGEVHQLEMARPPEGSELRAAIRRRVLMRASLRLPGHGEEFPLTVKDLSSTGMKARSTVTMFPGTRVEIALPHIGWVPGEIVRLEGEDAIGIRFAAVIDPDATQVRVSGSYAGPQAAPPVRLLRV
jgi:hypothetical protein